MYAHDDHLSDDQAIVAGYAAEPRGSDQSWDDQAVLDQALRLVADHHRALGAMIGRGSPAPTAEELRSSPLGRDLRLLARAARGAAAAAETRAAVARVEETLLRPLAADDYGVPDWFRGSALGRLLARAERSALGPDGLLPPAEAAARLGVREAEVAAWLADGSLPGVWDEAGRPLVPRAAVERRRWVARAFAEPAPERGGPTDDVLRVELRRAS